MSHTSLLAIRALRARPLRTVLTMFSVVLGVAVILAIDTTNFSTLQSVASVFNEASGKAHLVVTSGTTGGQGFAEDVLRTIASVPNVKTAVPSLQIYALLADEAPPSQTDISLFGTVAGGLLLYAIDPSVDLEVREYKIVAGQFLPSDLDAYNVVLVKDYADQKKIRLGTDLGLLTAEGIKRVRVAGFMSKEGPGVLNSGAFGIIPLIAAQELFGRSGELDQVDIVATPQAATSAGLDQLKTSLQTRLDNQYSVVYPATQGRRVTQMLGTYQMGLNYFSAIALFVGAFLIYNAFSMTVVERTREIGMLRTVGMTRSQVIGQILSEAGLVGALGSMLGVGGGILLSRGLIRVMEYLLVQEVRQIHVPLDGLAMSVLVGVSVTLAAALIPAWQAGRISPLEALRIRGNPRDSWLIRRGWVPGTALLCTSYVVLNSNIIPASIQYRFGPALMVLLFLGATLLIPITVGVWERALRSSMRRIYGSEGQLGSGNVQRAKLRTTLTVAALMVGVTMILVIRASTGAYQHDIRAWIQQYVGGDLYVHSSLPMRADLAQRLETVEGVAAVTPVRYFDVKWLKPEGGEHQLTYVAIDPLSYERVTSLVFAAGQGESEHLLQRLAEGDAVFISTLLSEQYGLKQGDTIHLVTRRGERSFQVAAVAVNFQNLGRVVQGSWKDMRRYFGINDVSGFLLKIKPGYALDEVRDRIDRLYGKRNHLTVESNQALKTRAFRLLNQAFSLFDALVLIGMVVAALGVVNTLTMNVVERTQEIGMLRSLGMTRRQVSKMILAEAGMMGLIGAASGLIFGLSLSRIVLKTTSELQGYELSYVLPSQGILASLLITLVVSQVAAVWPARRAAGIRIVEAIQAE